MLCSKLSSQARLVPVLQWVRRRLLVSENQFNANEPMLARHLSAQPQKSNEDVKGSKSSKQKKRKDDNPTSDVENDMERLRQEMNRVFNEFFASSRASGSGGGKGSGGSRKEPDNQQMQQILAVAGISFGIYLYLRNRNNAVEISWIEFVDNYLQKGKVKRLRIVNKEYALIDLELDMAGPGRPQLWLRVGNSDLFDMKIAQALQSVGLDRSLTPEIMHQTNLLEQLAKVIVSNGLSVAIFIGMFFLISRAMQGRTGGRGLPGTGGLFSPAGKSHAKVVTENTGVKFSDVAGCEEAKIEIMEFVNFLKNPHQYTALGAKIPKGAMLTGAPGTGKTLLAKATAGEAGVPFISANGSEFLEIFVGVGPQRVRELFKTARDKAPVILFIDEIDAIGRKRSGSGFGGNSERENTLNQLLVEMDGFNTSADLPVIVFAATNRGEVLDNALLRPGRFDRKIEVSLPDIKGRASICKVHLKPLTTELDKDEFAKKLAALLPGFSGADIANVCNESALIAAREGSKSVNEKHFDAAIGRVIGGLEKRSRVLQENERRTVAYHEAGHVIAGWFFEYAEPTLKVSIVPRGKALGFAQLTPKEMYLYSTDHLFHRMCQLFGGRVAEEVFFGKITSGAQDDLQKITNIAYSQVVLWGMDEEVGPVSFDLQAARENSFGEKPYSDETAKLIDERVRMIVRKAHKATTDMIVEHKQKLSALAEELMTKEIMSKEEIATVIGPRPFADQSTYEELVHGTGGEEEDTSLPEGLKNWNKSTEDENDSEDEAKDAAAS